MENLWKELCRRAKFLRHDAVGEFLVLNPPIADSKAAGPTAVSRWPPCSHQNSAGSALGCTLRPPHFSFVALSQINIHILFLPYLQFTSESKHPFPYSPMIHPQTFPLLNYFILSCLVLVYLGWNPSFTEVSSKTPIDSNGAKIFSFVLIRLWVSLSWIYLILSRFDCSFWIRTMLHLCVLSSV